MGIIPSGGRWAEHEIVYINGLKLKIFFISIPTCYHIRNYKHIRAMSDSSKANGYVNNKGGGIKSKKCSEITKEIMLWCLILFMMFKSFVSAAHTSGNITLKQTYFLENLQIIQNGNLILIYLIKLLNILGAQKLIFSMTE